MLCNIIIRFSNKIRIRISTIVLNNYLSDIQFIELSTIYAEHMKYDEEGQFKSICNIKMCNFQCDFNISA